MLNTAYRYVVENMMFIAEDSAEPIEIPSESIMSITNNYDYDKNNMPMIYINFNINTLLYDKMVEYADTGKIIFTFKKYNNQGYSSLRSNYIHSEFAYLIETDVDYHRSLNKMEGDLSTNTNSYKRGSIALIDLQSIDNNKGIFNGIIKDTNMISIVNKYTTHMPMVIEPFHNNENISTLIIPPISTLTELLKFLNDEELFYDSGYRFFRDFDKTYLLSNSGNPVDDGDDVYDTIILNILDTTDPESKSVGIIVDKYQKSYILNIDALDTHMHINLVQDKDYNTIIGITDNGEINKVLLESKSELSKERAVFVRANYKEDLDVMAKAIDSASVVLQISRTELDSSLFTPNKEYVVKNYSDYSEYDGRFLLSSKKEIFIQQDNEFISNTVLTFRKIME